MFCHHFYHKFCSSGLELEVFLKFSRLSSFGFIWDTKIGHLFRTGKGVELLFCTFCMFSPYPHLCSASSCMANHRFFHLLQGTQFYIYIFSSFFCALFFYNHHKRLRIRHPGKYSIFLSRIFSKKKKKQLRLNPCTHVGCIASVTCVQNHFVQFKL